MKKLKLSFFNVLQLSILIIFLIIFVFLLIASIYDPSCFYNKPLFISSIILFFIPLLVNIIIFIKTLNHKISDKVGIIVSTILGLFFIAYIIILIFIFAFLESINPVYNYKAYYGLYDSKDELINKFPNEIPSNAKEIEFYYKPGVMQANTEMGLSFKTDEKTIGKYINEYEKEAIWYGKKEDDPFATTDGTNVYNDSYFLNDGKHEIDNDYTVYYFVNYCDDSGYCNHGKYSVAIINKNENVCIFNYNYW